MFRVMISMLLIASFVIADRSRKDDNSAPSQTTTARSMHVTVSFNGLMAFHPTGSGYDVGILINRRDVAHDHVFKVSVDGESKPFTLSPGASWSLSVTNSSTGVKPNEVGHNSSQRYPDSSAGQYDLSWIIDMDKLHSGLTLKAGLLNPIIHLTDGVFFTRNKTEDMERWKGGAKDVDFGFFAETVALDIEIQNGQELVLADDKSGSTPVFRIPYGLGPPIHEVAITNSPDILPQHSDFPLYYNIISNINPRDQYDFRPKRVPRGHPYNPARKPTSITKGLSPTQFDLLTCCGLECNAILLSTTPLR